jgi:hypothetical protein
MRYEIWLSCDDCGDVVVAGEDCILIRAAGDVTLAYRCPACGCRAAAPVPDDELERLVGRGFVVRDARVALELTERRPIGPVLAWDDVLDAHETLASTDFVVALLLD